MDRPASRARHQRRAAPLWLGALLVALLLSLPAAVAVLAATPSPSPQPNPNVHIDARALLRGHVRPGAWTAVDVLLGNDGPSISGELRIRGQQDTGSQYGLEVQLPTGAKQRLTLYAQTQIFGSRVTVELVSGNQILAGQQVAIKSHDAASPIVAVIAERPEGLLPQINAALVNPNIATSSVITLGVADLPPRVEAWAAIDQLVWQDVDAATLTPAQAKALRLWLGAGGRLTILGGTSGIGTVRGFGDDLLPFDPQHTINAAPADLVPLVGQLPAGATTAPAIAGTLRMGTVLARSGDDTIAAETGYGRGTITLVGFNPADRWMADGSTATNLWHRLLPQISGPALNPLSLPDDSQIVYALQNLPSVDLPPIEQLLILLVAYIALIGPINYLVLRRLDKREWAWVTIPALVVVFAVGSYGLGATLKGSDVIVNEVAVVRAAQGSSEGIGQVYIGIYSPSRRSFQVSIPGGALLSNPISQSQSGQAEQPLDVLFGESTSQLRNFEVGFGVLRGFRAEAPVTAPAVESDLHLASGKLQGTITNRSAATLENLAIVFGGGVAVLPSLEAGQSRTIDLDTTGTSFYGYALSERVFGSSFVSDAATARKITTRRAVIDQLFSYGTVPATDTPLLLAWRDGAVLDVGLAGELPNRVGDGLFMIPLGVTLDAHQVFGDQAMRRSIIATDASQAWGDMNGLYLTRGTMTVEARPITFSGRFIASSLEIALTQGDIRPLEGKGTLVTPLPADQQADQDDPVGDAGAVPTPSFDPNATPAPIPPPDKPGGGPVPPAPGQFNLPAFQLFDHTTQQWVEFAAGDPSQSYRITDPERYVDAGGSVLFRFVNRAAAGQFGEDQVNFQLLTRIEGTIE